MNSKALFRQVCALNFWSNPFNSTQMDGDEDVEPPQSWTREMDGA